jgi:UDP-N-acetylmuramoyl-L-alanyl-D-glutamate--2,6-diaminopimelate ligase
MKVLQELLYRVPLLEVVGELTQPVRALQFDSRAVQQGDLFLALRGTQSDGHDFIEKALQLGATTIVCEQLPTTLASGVTYLRVKDSAAALGFMAANYFDNPSEALTLVGITGTNGKTTTATLLYQLFTGLGYPTGLISTVHCRIGLETLEATHTTPDPIQLQALLRRMVDVGCSYAFMEVSSHAVAQRRIAGLRFAGGVFTNITHDHLDYHGTFANYIKAKQGFFDGLPANAFALTNTDDKNGRIMVQNTAARVITYALRTPAECKTKVLENQLTGLLLDLDGTEVWCRLAGTFNAYNLTAVYATALALGQPKEETLVQLSQLEGADGRFQVLPLAQGIMGIVDYAHTPDALKNVLETVRALQQSGGRVVCLFGCGGDRDSSKRPVMGRLAAQLADLVILTSDNPRTEDPVAILDQIESGVPISQKKKILRVTDRREAIRTAARLVQAGDVLLVAGKGHETYQVLGNEKIHFDDREELRAAFSQLQA